MLAHRISITPRLTVAVMLICISFLLRACAERASAQEEVVAGSTATQS